MVILGVSHALSPGIGYGLWLLLYGKHANRCALAVPLSPQVLTQNLWCHYPMTLIKPYPPAQHGACFLQRLRCFADHVRTVGYDIVMVQELFLFKIGPFGTTTNFEFCAAEMQRAGLPFATDPSPSLHHERLFGQNSGVAIFSRWPITAEVSVDLATSERNNTKGFVMATVNTLQGPVRFLCTHLDSRSDTARRRQVMQISDYLTGLASREEGAPAVPVVVAGDFNICPQTVSAGGYDDGSQYRHLVACMGRPGLSDLFSADESVPTQEDATLDHIFLDVHRCWRVVDKRVVTIADDRGLTASDHLGVSVELHLDIHDTPGPPR